MGQGPEIATRRPLLFGVLAAAGVIYAAMASFTRPFTIAADVVTAVPLVVAASIAATRTPTVRGPTPEDQPTHRPDPPGQLGRWSVVWLAMTASVAGWELFCYLSAPRTEHPTLSTLLDMLDSNRVGKTSAFALWLLLGWYLVLR